MYIYPLRKISLYSMSLLYIVAGVNHFWHPGAYLVIMPEWAKPAGLLIILSGIFETAFGLLLLFRKTSSFAAWGLILLLIAVFPANIQMMFNYKAENNPLLWLSVLRLPLQILLIYWAYSFTMKPE